MSDASSTLIQQNPRPKLQGRSFSNWTWPDRVLALVFFILSALAFWFGGPYLGIFFLGPFVLLYRSSTGYGRVYVDLLKGIGSAWRNDFHNGIFFRAEDTEGPWLARWLRKRHPAIPLQHVRIQAEIDEVVERICLLHQTDRPYDHFFITATGGAFANADVNQQTRLVGEMNDLINQIISQSGLKAGISQLRITTPFNQMKVVKNFARAMDPIIARPELFELDDATNLWVNNARENARQIPLALEQHRASEVWAFVVITIKRRRGWSRLSTQQIAEVPIIELGHALIEGLRDSSNLMLQNVHTPDLSESALVARSSWDTVTLGDYYRRRESGEIPKSDEEIDAILETYMAEARAKATQVKSKRKRQAILNAGAIEGARAVDQLLAAWPQKCIEADPKGKFLRFDDNYIATLRVMELPKQFRSDQIMSLHWLVKNRWTRFAFVNESISGDTQSNMLVYKASALENYNRAFFGRRIIRDPRRTNKSRELSDQLEQMSVNTIAQMANGLITIIESNPKRLRRAVKEVAAKYRRIGFKTEQVEGSSRLIDYFISGALAANRI